MNPINDFVTVITNKINAPSSFYANSVCCMEPLFKIVKYAVLQSRYACNNFCFDFGDDTDKKSYFEDYLSEKDGTPPPVLFISQDCFDIDKETIDKIFEEYIKAGDIAVFDKNNKPFAYVISPEKVKSFAYDSETKKYSADYTVPSSLKELREKGLRMQENIFAAHEENGVQFVSFDGVGISPFAKIGEGTVIYPGTVIKGDSVIGANTVLGANTLIDSSVIGENCSINSAQIYSSCVGDGAKIGPFCRIRPNCRIESGVQIGNFVEVKNSNIGKNSQAKHLTYIGDSDVGERVNFGCGSITSNYDGVRKNRCVIGDDVFIGCNTNLIAPINIGEGAYTAAGSTLSIDIPSNVLAISRSREQKIVKGWVERHKNK